MQTANDEGSGQIISRQVLALLAGEWLGEGEGDYPTIDSFVYREKMTFELRSENMLYYMQRTEKQITGQTAWVTSHWESGFIRLLTGNLLELANVQRGGRGEVLVGKLTKTGDRFELDFKSVTLSNDARMVATARTFVLAGSRLHYEMMMHTTESDKLLRHLQAALRRVA